MVANELIKNQGLTLIHGCYSVAWRCNPELIKKVSTFISQAWKRLYNPQNHKLHRHRSE